MTMSSPMWEQMNRTAMTHFKPNPILAHPVRCVVSLLYSNRSYSLQGSSTIGASQEAGSPSGCASNIADRPNGSRHYASLIAIQAVGPQAAGLSAG
jgi:hypothetical protein